jgi:xanthine dehydrogenase large subunit
MSETIETPLHQSALHDSAYRHTSGEAVYVDDIPAQRGALVACLVTSKHAHGRIISVNKEQACSMEGIHDVLSLEDVPGTNLIGPIIHDEPLFADGVVHYVGQVIAAVIGENYELCRLAADAVEVEIAELPTILSIEEAQTKDAYHAEPHVIARGDVREALQSADVVIEGTVANGHQDHFYLETHVALALPLEDKTLHVYSSTQHPTEVQAEIAAVLGLESNKVVCEVPRMGGAFGGKESQATNFACIAALAAQRTGRSVKVWLNRDMDMIVTGKRHPFLSTYKAGFNSEGLLVAFQANITCDGGWSLDLSGPIMDRALFHLDNAYYIEHLRFEGRIARTNTPSNTAFRGFGGPQGMLVVEDAINRYSELMGCDPAPVRHRNLYGEAPRDKAPYGQTIKDNRLPRIYEELMASSDYLKRRKDIEAFNATQTYVSRGIGFQPVKFGISFTKAFLNQAGALILVYADGSVQLNHGGTEMGQGLHAKMLTIAAHELGVDIKRIRIMNTATDKVPNTSATAASSGSDLNGQAVADAARKIQARMRLKAAELLDILPAEADTIVFAAGRVYQAGNPEKETSFSEVATQCWLGQISLSATGYYCTPGVGYSHELGQGTPFFYYAFGGAVIEVEVHRLTGEYRVLRADILHDVGNSLVPSIDIGQVEGGFVQGLGWLTMEEVLYSESGHPLTTGPSTYKIPAVGDVPTDMRVQLLERAPAEGVIHGSKAVGEPPFMLSIAVLTALRQAIASFGPSGAVLNLSAPYTPEVVLRAMEELQA